jgi:hypothetical protein
VIGCGEPSAPPPAITPNTPQIKIKKKLKALKMKENQLLSNKINTIKSTQQKPAQQNQPHRHSNHSDRPR